MNNRGDSLDKEHGAFQPQGGGEIPTSPLQIGDRVRNKSTKKEFLVIGCSNSGFLISDTDGNKIRIKYTLCDKFEVL